jgi:hypothetical protein
VKSCKKSSKVVTFHNFKLFCHVVCQLFHFFTYLQYLCKLESQKVFAQFTDGVAFTTLKNIINICTQTLHEAMATRTPADPHTCRIKIDHRKCHGHHGHHCEWLSSDEVVTMANSSGKIRRQPRMMTLTLLGQGAAWRSYTGHSYCIDCFQIWYYVVGRET